MSVVLCLMCSKTLTLFHMKIKIARGCFIEEAYTGLKLEDVSRQADPQDDGYEMGDSLNRLLEGGNMTHSFSQGN